MTVHHADRPQQATVTSVLSTPVQSQGTGGGIRFWPELDLTVPGKMRFSVKVNFVK
jgi:hypothetical protein